MIERELFIRMVRDECGVKKDDVRAVLDALPKAIEQVAHEGEDVRICNGMIFESYLLPAKDMRCFGELKHFPERQSCRIRLTPTYKKMLNGRNKD